MPEQRVRFEVRNLSQESDMGYLKLVKAGTELGTNKCRLSHSLGQMLYAASSLQLLLSLRARLLIPSANQAIWPIRWLNWGPASLGT